MTNDSTRPPEALLSAIARDLRPVKAAPPPLRLVMQVLPLALLVSALILVVVGVRRDSHVLGPFLTWGASIAQFGLAIMLIWIAARESNPAQRLPKNMVYLAAIATFLVVGAIAELTFWTSPTTVSPRVTPWVTGVACSVGSTMAGGLLVGLLSWVFRTSLATRPTVAGALYGAGAGVAINAGWRLACPVSDPWHSFGAHGTAVVATVVLGALVGRKIGDRTGSDRITRR